VKTFLRLIRFCLLCVVTFTIPSCILDNPVSEVPDPSEFEYNYWLVSHWYLHSEEIKEASFYEGNTTKLYNSLSDPYTQYIPPSISDEAEQQINTSIVAGDIGVEILLNQQSEYPLFIYRIYPSSPSTNRSKISFEEKELESTIKTRSPRCKPSFSAGPFS
jgi:carboxyl-terminal processing protease